MTKLKTALEEFDAVMRDIGGCSNHGCYVIRRVGMGTNGPCHCLRNDHFKGQRIATAARRLRDAVEAEVRVKGSNQ